MRSQKPIKIKRTSDRTRWIVPVVCVAFTFSVSLVIALAWQNLSTDAMMAVPGEDAVQRQITGTPALAAALPAEEPTVPAKEPEEETVAQISDYYGVIFPESERATSEYFDDAVFIGDSLTTGIQLYDVMSGTTVLAATGISLSSITTSQVISTPEGNNITVLEALARGQYKKVYIMMGANGVGFLAEEQTLELYSAFIDEVKAICPDSIIYIQSILPVNEPKYAQRYGGPMTNQIIDRLNGELVKLAGEKSCLYLDVAQIFRDENGHMPEGSTPDGIHLYSAGYTAWFDYLKTHAYQLKEVETSEQP